VAVLIRHTASRFRNVGLHTIPHAARPICEQAVKPGGWDKPSAGTSDYNPSFKIGKRLAKTCFPSLVACPLTKAPMSSRREARERVLQALYAQEIGGGRIEHTIEHLIKPFLQKDRKILNFARSLFIRTLDLQQEADEIIDEHTRNWELARIALLDRLVLRMAICEFLEFEDIPPKVTINESIEVAKAFSTDNSGTFVNGVLDAALTDLHQKGRLKKSGRGLIGMQSLDQRTNS